MEQTAVLRQLKHAFAMPHTVNTSVEQKACHFVVVSSIGYTEQTYNGRLPLLPRDQCRSEAWYPLLD